MSLSSSGSSSGSSSSSNFLAPYYGPYLSSAEERGTARILKQARDNKWLESRGGSTLNPKTASKGYSTCHKMGVSLENTVTGVLLQITKYLDVKSLCRLALANRKFHELKPEMLKNRGDAVSGLMRYFKGNLKNPHPNDKKF